MLVFVLASLGFAGCLSSLRSALQGDCPRFARLCRVIVLASLGFSWWRITLFWWRITVIRFSCHLTPQTWVFPWLTLHTKNLWFGRSVSPPAPSPPNGGITIPSPPNGGITIPSPPNGGITIPSPPNGGITIPSPPNGGI